MSYRDASEPSCSERDGAIELVIRARGRDVVGLPVRRVLPAGRTRRSVGPFVFFDQMGPADFPPGKGVQVRPHPHIGLATITWLFEGELVHRDSLGYTQVIRPGAVNLMTAGRGIVHSERSGDDLDRDARLHGIQLWIALPEDDEERDPAFEHVAAGALPELAVDGVAVRVIIGAAFGERSPVTTYSATLYLEVALPAGSAITLPDDVAELGAYVASGRARLDGCEFDDGTLVVARPGRALTVEADTDARVMVIGGDPLGERHIDWNFVSSRPERIAQARDDWREGRFDKVPGDDEFIPLPD